VCSLSFEETAWVLEWHVIGMFAPGFVTGHLIKRFGVLNVMGVGVKSCTCSNLKFNLRVSEARCAMSFSWQPG